MQLVDIPFTVAIVQLPKPVCRRSLQEKGGVG